MSIRVMTAVFDYSEARGNDRLILLVIADRSDDDGAGCWRGKDSIARMARVSRGTVTNAIRRLELLGELKVDRRPGNTSEYQVVLPGVGQGLADPSGGGGLEVSPLSANPLADHPANPLAAIRPLDIPDTSGVAQARTPTPKAHRCPTPFLVSDAMVEWVETECPGLHYQRETEKFVDYWRAKGANATKLDWTATWRNWMRKAAEGWR